MDPKLFALDWDQTLEALAALVLLSMLVERALCLVFESKAFMAYNEKKDVPALREVIAFAVGIAACVYWRFDVAGIVFSHEASTVPGYVLTGAVVAGGSKGSVKLFRDVLGFKSGAYKEYEDKKKAKGQ